MAMVWDTCPGLTQNIWFPSVTGAVPPTKLYVGGCNGTKSMTRRSGFLVTLEPMFKTSVRSED